MGWRVLNVLLSFAQFEREIIAERIRDKIAANRHQGKWTGGTPIPGYDVDRSGPRPKLAVSQACGEQAAVKSRNSNAPRLPVVCCSAIMNESPPASTEQPPWDGRPGGAGSMQMT